MALAFSANKGRAHTYDMLRITQQLSALSVAGSFSFRVRWVPSEPTPRMALPGARSTRVLTSHGVATRFRVAPPPVRSLPAQQRRQRVMKVDTIPVAKKTKSRVLKSDKVIKPVTPGARRPAQRTPAEQGLMVGRRAQNCMMTILEERSVSSEVQHQYKNHHAMFQGFCHTSGISWPTGDNTGAILADFLDCLFVDGKSASEGEKVVAAVEFFNISQKGRLPRSRTPLKGSMVLAGRGEMLMATKLMIDHDCFLRPGESIELRGKDLVAPVPGGGPQYRHPRCRRREARQSRCLRQQCASQQPRQRVPWQSVAQVCEEAQVQERLHLPLQRCRVQKRVCSSWGSSGGSRAPPLPAAPRRRSRRSANASSGSRWSESAGPLAHGPECATVHESGEDSAIAEQTFVRKHGVLLMVESKPRACSAGDDRSKNAMLSFGWEDIFHVSPLPSSFCLELFAGTARISSAFLQHGVAAYPVGHLLFFLT